MFTLPLDAHYYYLSFLGFPDHRNLARVCKQFHRIVSKPLDALKIKRVLENPCHYHRLPEGNLKNFCWQALHAQEKLLAPFLAKDEFEIGGPGLARKGNLYLIALAGKVYFLVSCNLFAHPIAGISYKVEFKNNVLKITDHIEPRNAFESFKTSKLYDGVSCDGLIIGKHQNSNNWRSQFDYLGQSLFGDKYYLKIVNGDKKKIFLIKTTNDVVKQVFTSVYASNTPFHMAPYARVFTGSVIGIEHHHSCLILKNEQQQHSLVFVIENKQSLRVQMLIKAVLLRPLPY